MRKDAVNGAVKRLGVTSRRPAMAAGVMLGLTLGTTGCLSSLSKHSAALSAATAPVVDQAAATYHAAESLHDLREDYDAVAQFDGTPVYNPRKIVPLMTEKEIDIRLTVLEAFQCYAASLVEITSGVDSPALDAASKSVGLTLTHLGNAVGPAIESTLGVAATTASTTETTVTTVSGGVTTTTSSSGSTAAPVISDTARKGISVAADALAQYLVSRKIKKELPGKIREMDGHLQALCELLEKDLDVLQDQERRDYNRIINLQTEFVRAGARQTPPLGLEDRRQDIMKLPEIVRQQRTAEEQMLQLRGAIVRLALTHHALAAEAQGNNPESLKSRMAELAAAGSDLGKFYTSLTAQ